MALCTFSQEILQDHKFMSTLIDSGIHFKKDHNKLFLAEVIGPAETKWYELVRSIDPCSAQSKVEKFYNRPGSNIDCAVYISTIIE